MNKETYSNGFHPPLPSAWSTSWKTVSLVRQLGISRLIACSPPCLPKYDQQPCPELSLSPKDVNLMWSPVFPSWNTRQLRAEIQSSVETIRSWYSDRSCPTEYWITLLHRSFLSLTKALNTSPFGGLAPLLTAMSPSKWVPYLLPNNIIFDISISFVVM